MSKPKLLLDEKHPTWYSLCSTVADRSSTIPQNQQIPSAVLSKFRSAADDLLEKERQSYMKFRESSGDVDSSWVERTTKSGTLSDRIASMTLLIGESPVHRLEMLGELIDLAGKDKRISVMAGDALRDIFTQTLLPPDRQLVTMARRPLEKYTKNVQESLSPKVLMLWRYEEKLRGKHREFLGVVESWLSSPLDAQKKYGLHTAISLLSSSPEAESNILSLVVNKLGDPAKKAAAAAGHQLRRLLDEHPNMTDVVAKEESV